MSQYERGPRGGSEPPLKFEPRRPVRGGGPAPVTLVLSILLLAVIAGGAFFLYRGGVRGPNEGPRPVGTPIGDVRTPAPPEAHASDPGAGLSIYKDDIGADSAPAFAPAPEQPAPRPAPAAAPPAVAASAPPTTVPPPVRTVMAPPPPAKPPHPPVKVASAAAVETKPIAKREPTANETAAATAIMDTPAKPAKSDDHGPVVQIGAYSSTRQADQGWDAAAAAAPASMAGKGKTVQTVSRGGATFYRTAITGFGSRREAQALCDKLQAAGKHCFVR